MSELDRRHFLAAAGLSAAAVALPQGASAAGARRPAVTRQGPSWQVRAGTQTVEPATTPLAP